MSKQKFVINIQNPLPGGRPYTNLRRANHFVALGRAEWVGSYLIRFVSRVEEQIQIAAMVKQARASAGLSDTDPEAGGLATVDQVGGLPVAGPPIRLFYT